MNLSYNIILLQPDIIIMNLPYLLNKTLSLSVCVFPLIEAEANGPTGKRMVPLDAKLHKGEKWLKISSKNNHIL